MRIMITFVVHIPPTPKGRPRFWNGRVLTDKRTRTWEREFAALVAKHMPVAPLKGPLSLKMHFWVPKPKSVKREAPSVRPDLDNYAKAVMDGLKAFWIDDAQIVHLEATKRYGEIASIGVEIGSL